MQRRCKFCDKPLPEREGPGRVREFCVPRPGRVPCKQKAKAKRIRLALAGLREQERELAEAS